MKRMRGRRRGSWRLGRSEDGEVDGRFGVHIAISKVYMEQINQRHCRISRCFTQVLPIQPGSNESMLSLYSHEHPCPSPLLYLPG
jgi:hypothetical protein